MSTAGFNEAIWHFLGYLRITDALQRADKLLDGANVKTITIDVVATPPPPSRPNLDVDDLSSRPVFARLDSLAEERSRAPVPFDELDDLPHAVASARASALAAPALPHALAAGPAVAVSGAAPRVIHVSYDDGAWQTLDSVLQLNRMVDDDLATADHIRVWTGAGWSDGFARVENAPALQAAIDRACDEVPPDIAVDANADASAIAAFVKARDHAWSAHPDDHPQVAAGRYVDGEASDAEPARALPTPELEGKSAWPPVIGDDAVSRTIHGPSDGIGTVAYAGGNELTNAAVIRDLGGMNASIIIEGDAYLSNAIVQVNVLVDNDHARLIAAGDDALLEGLLRSAHADGNAVHNIAEFVTHEYSAVLKGAALTPEWRVDVVDGDFFSVRALSQINYGTDDDRICQYSETTFQQLRTGGNQQVNIADIYGVGDYDIIIIGGDCHRVNWIFQKNIVLDGDWTASLLRSGEGGEQSAWTGGNDLRNEATISTYGNAGYLEISDAQHDLIAAIARGETILSPQSGWNLAGSASGVLKILYVTGDYYDLNLICQTNVLSDMDQAAQLAAGEGAVVQGLATGGNAALNYAYIVDAGTLSGSCYLGGEAYADSMLIQADLVTDSDDVVVQDATAYVPEIIAFTDAADCPTDGQAASAPVRAADPALLDNPGNVLT